jgi:hypothetical protein
MSQTCSTAGKPIEVRTRVDDLNSIFCSQSPAAMLSPEERMERERQWVVRERDQLRDQVALLREMVMEQMREGSRR